MRVNWIYTVLFIDDKTFKDFRLKTVTFGVANSPYLAIRSLEFLAKSVEDKYPGAASIIQKCMYMDDVMSGCHSTNELSTAYTQLKSAFGSGCFNLCKWCSNSQEFLSTIPIEDREMRAMGASVKALGVSWSALNDDFSYDVSMEMNKTPSTKRQLASEIATLFDPLGWLSPVTMKAKHILQLLWKENLKWDENVPERYIEMWLDIKNEIHEIKNMKIPRWINYVPGDEMELHGFYDASETGFAAAVFVRNKSKNTVNLLVAKSKVSPIKDSSNDENVTILRLELCGAVLLAELVKRVKSSMDVTFSDTCLWSDSKIALAWIVGDPQRYRIFIGSRIAKIQKLVGKDCWHHVSSENNAAKMLIKETELEQLTTSKISVNTASVEDSLPDAETFDGLIELIAYENRKSCDDHRMGSFLVSELTEAENSILKRVQSDAFVDELKMLKSGKSKNIRF